jgi:FixJ family two-component response regulator
MVYYGQSWSQEVRVAPAIELSQEEEAELIRLAHSKATSVRLAQRARIVLLAAQGLQNKEIAEQLGIGRVQVGAGASATSSPDWRASSATCRAARRRSRWTWPSWWS